MVVSISQSFLFKYSLRILRKYLTYEKNYIDCIISVPGDSKRYMRPEIICVFKKNRSSDDVLFIDLTNEDVIKKVPLSRIRAARKYNQLDNEMIKKLTDTYAERQIITKITKYAHHILAKCSGNVILSPPLRRLPL